jgi:hypothetical protein
VLPCAPRGKKDFVFLRAFASLCKSLLIFVPKKFV